MNMGFIVLYVADIEKEKAFYLDIFGMTVVEAASSPTFVTLRPTGGSLLSLQDRATSRLPPKHAQPGSIELSFESDDIDGTWKLWKEKGVEMVTDPIDLPFGRYFMAKDPEGYYLSVYRFNR